MQAPSVSSSWQRLRLYVCSTFEDMHAERDLLAKWVLPRLAECCERRRLWVNDVDLRWGVTEEHTRNRRLVEACFQRIDECRPFFLCFLGQRYGHQPSEQEGVLPDTLKLYPGLETALEGAPSITELEILHAVVNPFLSIERQDVVEPGCALFFLRDGSYLADLPSEPVHRRRIYTDTAEADEIRQRLLKDKLEWLRGEIVAATGAPVYNYTARWSRDAHTPELALPLRCPASQNSAVDRWRERWQQAAGIRPVGLDLSENPAQRRQARELNQELVRGRLTDFRVGERRLGEILFESLRSAIERRFPEHTEIVPQSELERERYQQERFVFERCQGFVARKGDFDRLSAYAGGDSRRLLALAAPAGMGKSTLLANWIDDRRRTGADGETLHYRFLGQSDGSASVAKLLGLLLRELREAGKLEPGIEIPADPGELREIWPAMLRSAGGAGRTIVVLDALNQLDSGLSDLRWLPRRLPAGVRWIASFDNDDVAGADLAARFAADPAVELVSPEPFDALDRRRLVESHLDLRGKQLGKKDLEALVSVDSAHNPLFLQVVLSELEVFGVFGGVAGKIRHGFGKTPRSAFDAVLERLETDPAYSRIPPATAVPLFFGLLANARRGLSAHELTCLLARALHGRTAVPERDAADAVETLAFQVWPLLARREGRFDFFHQRFREAAGDRYAGAGGQGSPGRRPEQAWNSLLADYFRELPISDAGSPTLRKLGELPHHLLRAARWQELAETLSDLDFIAAKCAAGMTYDLAGDFDEAMAVIRKLRGAGSEEGARRLRLAAWVEELAAYGRGEIAELGSPPSAARVRASAAAERRLADSWPEWQERIEAFARFVSANSDQLTRHRLVPGFAAQQARNSARDGPVATAGRTALGTSENHFLLAPAQLPAFQRHPAEIRTLAGHRQAVRQVAMTPDGRRAVSTASDNLDEQRDDALRVWDLDSGECLWALADDGHQPISVAISADGRSCVSGGEDGCVKLWDLESGDCLANLEGHSRPVVGVALTADGGTAASLSNDGMLRVWDLAQRRCRRIIDWLAGDPRDLSAVCLGLSLDAAGRRAVVAGTVMGDTGGAVGSWLWDLETGRCEAQLTGHREYISALASTPAGTRVVSGGWDRRLAVWDLEKGEHLKTIEAGATANDLAITADGRLALAANATRRDLLPQERPYSLTLWDLETGRRLTTLEGHQEEVSAVALSADGSRGLSGSGDRTLRVWDLYGETSAGAGKDNRANAVALSPNGAMAVCARNDTSLRLWDVGTGEQLGELRGHDNVVNDVDLISDGRFALSACTDFTLRAWDLEASERALGVLRGHAQPVHTVRITADGQRAVSTSEDRILMLWDLHTGEPLRQLDRDTYAFRPVAMTPDGRTCVSVGRDHSLSWWDLESGDRLARFEGHTDRIKSIRVAPDGRSVLSAGMDGSARLWSLRDRKCERVLAGHDGPVICAELSPDGRSALSAASSGEIFGWNLASGERLLRLEGPEGWGETGPELRLTPDGARLVAAGRSTLALWDPRTKQPLAIFEAGSPIGAVSRLTTAGGLVCCTANGEVVLSIGACSAPVPVTCVRRWRFAPGGAPGRWDDELLASCPWCGHGFRPAPDLLAAVAGSYEAAAGGREGVACHRLRAPGRAASCLESTCPSCAGALILNPFLVDGRARRERLRRSPAALAST